MSNAPYSERPESLFSHSEPVVPEPATAARSAFPPAFNRLRYGAFSLPVKAAINLAITILAVVIVGISGALGLNNLNFQVDNLYNFMLIPINAIQEANQALSDSQKTYLLISTGRLSAQAVAAEAAKIRAGDDQFAATLQRYDAEWVTTLSDPFTQMLRRHGRLSLQADEAAALARVHGKFDEYVALRDAALPHFLSGDINTTELDQLSDQVQAEMDRLIEISLEFALISDQDAVQSYRTSTTAMLVTGVLVSLLGAGLLLALLRSILLPLNSLRDAASRVTAGGLDAQARVFADDEIGLVAKTFNVMTARLRDLVSSLENRVSERTRDLSLAADVGQRLSAVRDLDSLLAEAVELIRARFDLYYTQIYLTNPSVTALELRAGTGEVGQELLRRAHRLPIGPGSLNGRAAGEKQAVIVADTRTAASRSFRPNPLLPDTRSEMCVPLLVGDRVVGVLDLQSARPGALTEENLPAFQALAGQLAVAVQNANLFAEAQQAHAEVEAQARRLTRTGWQDFLNAVERSEHLGFTYDQAALKPLNEPLKTDRHPGLAAPITITGESVGTIQIEGDAQRAWTQDEAELVTLVARQVAQQVENLRLLAQAEEARAEAEQATRRLTREGWETYLQSAQNVTEGYAYDLNQVRPLTAEAAMPGDGEAPLVQALTVQGEAIGELIVLSPGGSSGAETALVAAVAERLSAHLENLRLYAEAETNAQRAQTLVENAPEAIVVVDVDTGLFADPNENAVKLYGLPREELVKVGPAQLSPLTQPDGRPSLEKAIEKITEAMNGGAPVFEWMHRNAQGRDIPCEVRLVRLPGVRPLVRASVTDITERKEAQEALAKRAVELATVAEVSTVASTILEAERLLQEVVDLTKERFGLYHAHIYLLDEAARTLNLAVGAGEVGRQMVAQQYAIPLDREQSLVARAARTRQGVIVNDVRSAPDFLPNPLLPETRSEMALPLIVGERVLGVFDVQADVVNRFTDEDLRVQTALAGQVAVALQNANLYAEQAATVARLREIDQLKSSFLANMSHELRTPLNSIIGFTDVILEGINGPLTDMMENDLKVIRKNGQHLLNLINDVLDMAKIEAGRLTLAMEPFDLLEVLSEVIDLASPLARDKDLDLRLDMDLYNPIELEADRFRLRQVIINLVNNSVKFTEAGHVTVRAAQTDGRVRITVQDTGLGIPASHLEAIFQEFTQVDTSTTRKVGGTGLGLPISRRLIEMHGGRLWAESAGVPGEGSTFIVELPVVAQVGEAMVM